MEVASKINRRLRLRRTAVGELGKITKNKDVSLETKATITHTLVFPVTICTDAKVGQ